MSAYAKPKVIIFCDHLLYPSETFIHGQASALSRFEPVYAGSRRVPGLDMRAEQIITSARKRAKQSLHIRGPCSCLPKSQTNGGWNGEQR